MTKGKQKAWRKGAQVVNILRSVMSDSRGGHTLKRARSDKANAATATVGALGRLCGAPGTQRLAAQGYTAPGRRSDRMVGMAPALGATYCMVHTGDDYVEQVGEVLAGRQDMPEDEPSAQPAVGYATAYQEYQAALNAHGHDGPADGAQA